MQSDLLNEIKRLSVSERILLVEDIWDGIVDADGDALTLSETQRVELDRRIDAYRQQPETGKTWHEIQEEYRRGGR
ncbi:MAG: addiction module protein [Desulfuromonadales bacterium]|nr:addiction module protein [Desulfuromonadales bacterium]